MVDVEDQEQPHCSKQGGWDEVDGIPRAAVIVAITVTCIPGYDIVPGAVLKGSGYELHAREKVSHNSNMWASV